MVDTHYPELVREIGKLNGNISELQAEIKSLDRRFDEVVITQLKDHGRRLATLEAAENKRVGAMTIIAAISGVVGAAFVRMFF